MVMFKSQKNVFWQALVIALFLFFFGVLFGYYLENYRANIIENLYFKSEFYLMDAKIQNEIYSFSDISCQQSLAAHLNFSNRIYEEFKILDQYEESSKITSSVVLEHKKYDLLRALFWVSSIKLKDRCNFDYHDVVYLYDYNKPRLDIKAKQYVFANVLHLLQEEEGDKVILIPLAGDNDIASISSLMGLYNVSEEELPVVLIDEKIKITNMETVEDLKQYIK